MSSTSTWDVHTHLIESALSHSTSAIPATASVDECDLLCSVGLMVHLNNTTLLNKLKPKTNFVLNIRSDNQNESNTAASKEIIMPPSLVIRKFAMTSQTTTETVKEERERATRGNSCANCEF